MADKQESEAKTASALVKRGSADGGAAGLLEVWSSSSPALKQDPDLMFTLCTVQPGSAADKVILKQIEPPREEVFEVPASQVFNANTNLDPLTYNDIGTIPHQNIPCVLDFLRVRYINKVMYTSVEPLIVAVNPFQDLQNGTPEVIAQYRDAADCEKLPPHIFQISRRAVDNLHGVKKSQTIVVSGESGAGKTETTKQLMKYFASARSGNLDTRIQQAIMAANPVLEVGPKYYREQTQLREFRELLVETVSSEAQKQITEFEAVVKAFESMGLKEEQRHTIWSVVSGVLLMGNVKTSGKKEGGIDNAAVIAGESANVLRDACDLLFLDYNRVATELTVKVTYAGNNKVEGRWTVEDSDMLRGSLAKAMYEKMFLWIIQALNSSIEPKGGFQTFMGLLDIFGFEVFQNNSLEQLFINITNEMLQGFLFKNKDVLRPEMVEVVQASPNPVIRALFEGVKVEKGKIAKGSLIGSQFLAQLNKLMTLIGSTEAHFEFVQQFQFIDMAAANLANAKESAQAIVTSAQLESGTYAFGKTMIFLKPESAKYLVHLQRSRLAAWGPLVGVIEAIYVQKKLQSKKQAFAICSRICAHARRKLAQQS
ncbi:hypothetical protein Emag_004173 [Eimeria magna]